MSKKNQNANSALNISRLGSAQGITNKNPLPLDKLDYSIRVVFILFHTFKIRYGGKQHKLHNILDQSWFYFTTKNCDAKDTLCQPGLFILNNTNYITFWVSPGFILQTKFVMQKVPYVGHLINVG